MSLKLEKSFERWKKWIWVWHVNRCDNLSALIVYVVNYCHTHFAWKTLIFGEIKTGCVVTSLNDYSRRQKSFHDSKRRGIHALTRFFRIVFQRITCEIIFTPFGRAPLEQSKELLKLRVQWLADISGVKEQMNRNGANLSSLNCIRSFRWKQKLDRSHNDCVGICIN